LKKYFTSFLLATFLFWGTVLVVWYAQYTIASSEKRDEFSGVTYGYRVKQYYFWNSASLTIRLDRGTHRQMESSFNLPRCTIEKIEEHWLSNDGAIYLNIRVRHYDSTSSVDSLKVIYDYHRGEMFMSSKFTLWRFWNEKKKPEAWMSESEFNEVLSRYSSGGE
jgi:hypothetical protein